MLKKGTIDFYFGLFERGVLPEIYSNISYVHNNDSIKNLSRSKDLLSQKNGTLYIVKYIPNYLNPYLEEHFRVIKIFEIKGYAISLRGISSVEEYLTIQLKRKHRTSLINRKSRLEHCFNIRYEVYSNQISKEIYSNLMSVLHEFLVLRFEQRNESNERLIEWDKFYDLFFTLINNQRASFFAIYENDKPIALSLNYHLDKIFFGAISSYDIDYAKFGLGQILVFKRLEWCIQNNMDIFDMSMGNSNYKIKWCNTIYDFEHHIVYRFSSMSESVYARIIAFRMFTKNFLKSKNVHIIYRRIKTMLVKKSKNSKKINQISERLIYRFEAVINKQPYNNLTRIDFNTKTFAFLKQSICDFVYKTSEHISNIEVMEIEKDKLYLIKGNTHAYKVIFYNN